MGFLNTNSMPMLVEKLADGDNIKITGNSKGNRVGTVVKKIVEKADDVTKAIEQEVINDSYSFKVGTGNVDVSSDVEDGFGEVGIKGVTYQNCLKFTDDITFNLNLENWNIRAISSDKILVKPNTVYTMIIYVSNVTVSHNELLWVGDVSGKKNSITDEIIKKNVTMGINTFKFTTNSNPEDKAIRFQGSKFVEGVLTFKPLLLEGDHTNNPNLPSYFEGIVGVGDKSKNLLNPNSFKSSTGISMIENQVINIDVPTDGGQRTIFEGLNLPAGTYRVTTKVLEGEYAGGNLLFYDSNGRKFTEVRLIGSYTINATNNNINKLSIWAVKGICKIRIQLEKGSSETPYEPYYDGHKIEILSHGKNLWNGEFEVGSIDTVTGLNISAGVNRKRSFFIRVNPNTKYMIKQYDYKDSNDAIFIHQYTLDKHPIEGFTTVDSSKLTLWTSNNTHFIKFRTQNERDLKYNSISITQEEKDTEFCEYVSDKTQILLDEPLMRLPHGVRDEITRDGKLIRRVGKVVLDGSENWNLSDGGKENTIRFSMIPQIPFKISTEAISDKFPYYQNTGNNVECFTVASDTRIHIRIARSKLNVANVQGFKEWLSQNPTTVYYELETPIVEELPAPYLRIFKDGHLTFNTLVAPESNHVVQLNKSAQIEKSIREVQGLDSRVGQLESFYDDMMLETSHKLNLLTYDFEYTKESEDI